MSGHGKLLLVAAVLNSLIFIQIGKAIDAVADAPQNARWRVTEKNATATFLSGDSAETAVLVLAKAKALGQTFTVTSDASYLVLKSGTVPKVVFKIAATPDGTATKVAITGGDSPTLFFNDKEDVQQQGKWIQMRTSRW